MEKGTYAYSDEHVPNEQMVAQLVEMLDSGLGLAQSINDFSDLDLGTLIISGTMTQESRDQINSARKSGFETIQIDIEDLFCSDTSGKVAEFVSDETARMLRAGMDVVVYVQNEPIAVSMAIRNAARLGYTEENVSHLISEVLADIANRINHKVGLARVIMLGSETAQAVSKSLGIKGSVALEEIEQGVPVQFSYGNVSMISVVKPGTLGSPNFLIKANQYLKELCIGLTQTIWARQSHYRNTI